MSRAEAEEHLKAKAPSWSFTKVDGGVDAMGREYKFRRYKDAASFVNEVVDIVHDLQVPRRSHRDLPLGRVFLM